MASGWRIFILLLWKNFIVRKRHWIVSSLMQIGLPLLIFALTQISRDYASVTRKNPSGNNEEKDMIFPIKSKEDLMGRSYFSYLYFSPKNDFTEKIINSTGKCLMLRDAKKLKGFTSEEDLLNAFTSLKSHDVYSGSITAVIFKNSESHSQDIKHFEYTIRPEYSFGFIDGYQPFLQIQMCLDQSFLQMKMDNEFLETKISMQQMPFPAYKDQSGDYDIYMRIMYAIVAVMMFSIELNIEIGYPANEKTLGVNVLMAMNGVKNYQNLLSWLISGLIFSLFYIIPRIILLCVCFVSGGQPFLYYGNVFIVTMMHFVLFVHLISFGLHISSYFSKPIFRSLGIHLIYVGSYGLQMYLVFQSKVSSLPYLGILFPNILIFRMYEEIDIYEKKLEGVKWSNFFLVGDTNYPPAGSLGVMLIFAVLGILFHFFMALYISELFPGKFGVSKHPLFFMKFLKGKNKISSKEKVEDVNYKMKDILFEPVPKDVYVPGIQIRNLKKTYITNYLSQAKKQALDGVSIDFYAGQITTLLGHNGAGKTTMMSILTGLLSPTDGTVFINGKDISEDMDKIVIDLGLCPQEDILFPDLNVFEQIQFFCMLRNKNKSKAEIKSEVNELLEKLKISEKRNELPAKLSGGQKRRVCLGMAIIGDASTLILDEPTSGMDPETRREVWDILLKMRGEKTILISTHNMEEADVLGDRTAIIELGKLKSYGTPLFLKKFYGEGNMEVTLSTEDGYDIDIIKSHLPRESKLINLDAGKVVFSIPFTDGLPDNLDKIEEEKLDLGVTGISVSLITLEQVFLRATKEDDEKIEDNNFVIEPIDKVEGFQRYLQSFLSLLLKKFTYTRKNFITSLLMIVIPLLSILFLKLTFVVIDNTNEISLRLDMYNNPQAFYSSNDENYAAMYQKMVENFKGGATKIDGNMSQAILNFGKKDYVAYRNNLIAGASFDIDNNSPDIKVNALYSSKAEHSVPIALNLISNTILKKKAGEDHQIDVSRQKLPNVKSYFYNNIDLVMNYVRAFVLILCLSVTFALYVIQPLRESSSGIKELQKMTGITSSLYWSSFFTFDVLFFCFTSVLLLLGLYCLDIVENLQLFHGPELGIMFLLLMLFSFNMLPFVYLFSFWKKKTNVIVAISVLLPYLIVLLEAIIFIIMLTILDRPFEETLKIRAYEKRFFMLVPSVSFFYGQRNFFETAKKNADCRTIPKYVLESICSAPKKHMCCELNCSGGKCEKYFEYFGNFEKTESLEESVLYLCLTPILYFLIIALLESKIIPKLIIKLKKVNSTNTSKEIDDQVKAEKIFVASEINELNVQGKSVEVPRRREQMNGNGFVSNGNTENNSIYLAYELSKYYGDLAAVKEISFSVRKKECFGLLGVNGSGKSTTFRMLTGEDIPNSGIMYLNGKGIFSNEREYLAQLGYCPQSSALIKSLNSEDHLKLFASLRGVPKHLISTEVEKWIKRLKLSRCSNQPSGTYSGGNKRRLSIATALIGNPNLVLLDEPTTGVDPAARRSLWHVIKSCQLAGQSIILTSHSMEECEALCNRLVIMVKGQFVCIGPSEQLKQKFGAGFDINIKVNPERTSDQVANIKRDMENSLQCELRDEHVGYITYHVMDSTTRWKTMYTVMQQLKEEYNCVEDFSILSATLEQLFLQFARADLNKNAVGTV